MTDDTLLDVRAAAERLGMTEDAVRKAIARGTLAARRARLGRGRRFVVDDRELTRYMREHRTPRRSAP